MRPTLRLQPSTPHRDALRDARRGDVRRGAATMDYMLATCVMLGIIVFFFPGNRYSVQDLIGKIYEMQFVFVTWPFL